MTTYAQRIIELENEGLTTSDAQAVADDEERAGRVFDWDPAHPMDGTPVFDDYGYPINKAAGKLRELFVRMAAQRSSPSHNPEEQMTVSNRTEWDPRMDAGYIEPAPTCANCCQDATHLDDVCLVSALLACLKDRGAHTDEQLAQLAAKVDTNYLWNHLGRLLDDLGDGKYSTDYDESEDI